MKRFIFIIYLVVIMTIFVGCTENNNSQETDDSYSPASTAQDKNVSGASVNTDNKDTDLTRLSTEEKNRNIKEYIDKKIQEGIPLMYSTWYEPDSEKKSTQMGMTIMPQLTCEFYDENSLNNTITLHIESEELDNHDEVAWYKFYSENGISVKVTSNNFSPDYYPGIIFCDDLLSYRPGETINGVMPDTTDRYDKLKNIFDSKKVYFDIKYQGAGCKKYCLNNYQRKIFKAEIDIFNTTMSYVDKSKYN